MNRRDGLFCLSSFAIYALLGETKVLAEFLPGERTLRQWIAMHRELAIDLKSGRYSQVEWNAGVEQLSREVDLPELVASLDKLPQNAHAGRFSHDPVRRQIRYLEDGRLISLPYEIAIVTLDEGQFLPPHAHRHVASANLVVDGSVRVRTWDQIAHDEASIRARARSDDLGEVGYVTSTTTNQNNVHWFAPRSKRARMVAISIGGVGLETDEFDIFPVDLITTSTLDDGSVLLPIITWEEAAKRYSADM